MRLRASRFAATEPSCLPPRASKRWIGPTRSPPNISPCQVNLCPPSATPARSSSVSIRRKRPAITPPDRITCCRPVARLPIAEASARSTSSSSSPCRNSHAPALPVSAKQSRVSPKVKASRHTRLLYAFGWKQRGGHMLKPRDAICNLTPYHPPLAGREGLRMDFNENTAGCSPKVLERLRSLTAEDLTRYPERAPLERRIAEFLALDPSQVLLTNGVDEAIHLLCSAYLEPGAEAVVPVPTFAMYELSAQAAGATVVRVPAGGDFAFP